MPSIGAMRERLVIQRNDSPVLSVSSLTRVNTTATGTTMLPHGFRVGDYVTLAGSTIAGWNAKVKLVTVPSTTTFTFTCSSALTTPATGTITVTYTSNAQGGQGTNVWRTLDTVPAEMIALRAGERLQFAAIQSGTAYRFRIRVRPDLSTSMQILWTPSGSPGSPRKTLTITGLPPEGDGRTWQFIEASE
jgi:head-tail adaptor